MIKIVIATALAGLTLAGCSASIGTSRYNDRYNDRYNARPAQYRVQSPVVRVPAAKPAPAIRLDVK